VTLLTDPIISAFSQYAWRLGWLGAVLLIAVSIRLAYEDYLGYVAMGVFAIPAIITFSLPWDAASILMVLSAAILSYMGEKVVFDIFRG
jgi:hypothetical protein